VEFFWGKSLIPSLKWCFSFGRGGGRRLAPPGHHITPRQTHWIVKLHRYRAASPGGGGGTFPPKLFMETLHFYLKAATLHTHRSRLRFNAAHPGKPPPTLRRVRFWGNVRRERWRWNWGDVELKKKKRTTHTGDGWMKSRTPKRSLKYQWGLNGVEDYGRQND
jgi:hypothetical protein